MTQVIPLAFRELLCKGGIRVGHTKAFDADPLAWFWERAEHDPDEEEQLLWLNTHTPGWLSEIRRTSFYEVDLPIGVDERGAFIGYEVTLVFRDVSHRDAWRARQQGIRDEAERRRAYVARRKEEAAQGVLVCDECGADMVTKVHTETARMAQFAFLYSIPKSECTGCGCHSFSPSHMNAVSDACEAAVTRVGLPDYSSPGWTEAIGDEWRRRRKAPPEIEIAVTPEMSASDILGRLDGELRKRGRTVGQRPVLVDQTGDG